MIVPLALVFLGSCFFKTSVIKNPCHSPEFLDDLEKLSKQDLRSLKKVFKHQTHQNSSQNACVAALLAKIYLVQGDGEKASHFYSIAAEREPDFADYFLLAKASAEVKNGRWEEAKAIAKAMLNTETFKKSKSFAHNVHRVLAQVAVQQADNAQIIETHRILLDGFEENESLLLALANALKKAGEKDKYRETLKRILVKYPTSLEASFAKKSLGPDVTFSENEDELRFANLLKSIAFDTIKEDVAIARPQTQYKDPKRRAALDDILVKAHLYNNEFERGVSLAKERALMEGATAKDFERYAFALGKVDRFIEAANFYDKFMAKSDVAGERAKACFFKGFSLFEASLYPLARLSWQGCKKEITNSPLLESFLWHNALSAILDHDVNTAKELLRELEKEFPKSAEANKYRYFLGRVLTVLGEKSSGEEVMQALSKMPRPDYYCLLAQKSVKAASIEGITVAGNALETTAKNIHNPEITKGLALFYLGFIKEARDLVMSASVTSADRLAVLQHMGLYHDAWQRAHLADSLVKVTGNKLTAGAAVRATYAVPHLETVKALCQKYRIDEGLVYAIMRQESGFAADAKSRRGALGLMQMMPFVANDLALKLKVSKFTAEQLTKPEVSLEFAILLIATLKRQFKDSHFVIAAYNAGPHQVQKWQNQFGHLPQDLFVERIPFKETKEYIKKVLPSASIYNGLGGKSVSLAF